MSMSDKKVRTPRGSRDLASLKTILIVVNEEPLAHVLFQAILQRTPYIAFLAANSVEAMNITKDIKPDVLLLDSNLPGVSGIELYDQLHATRTLEDIPAIILSVYSPQQEHEIEQRQLAILWKPFTLDNLLSTIQRVLATPPP